MNDISIPMKMNHEGYRLLCDQKRELLQLLDDGKATVIIHGVVHLLDHIQDEAVKSGVPEKIVFPYMEDDNE